ncbi:MAG: 4-hydroxy-tetrahydrodipicolinate reductase [Deltaproteobacteria bacterium]|jgi:4-hydroxy-tetrahydrodipicolinate reductase|nr:4-hydroxy-tetrahydrodipicolinate reductase [Deltaproteobacteria bacterium]
MPEPIKILVNGAGGRMGQRLVQLVYENPALSLAGALERADSPHLGKDAGVAAGIGPVGVTIGGSFPFAAKDARVMVDFSSPEGVSASVPQAAQAGIAAVIGVTALGPEILAKIREAAAMIPILHAPNMSFGVNLLYRLVAEASRVLGPDYDAEIIEIHHNRKKDAPSGTALKLLEILADSRDLDPETAKRFGRSGTPGARTRGEIGVHAVRGGDAVGEHTVLFAGPGEVLEISHHAQSRDAFATGAIVGATWIAGKKPGLYSFAEVLGFAKGS